MDAFLELVEVAADDDHIEVREPDRVSLGAARVDPAEPLPTGGTDIVALLGSVTGFCLPFLVALVLRTKLLKEGGLQELAVVLTPVE